jgi:hypothetical protein
MKSKVAGIRPATGRPVNLSPTFASFATFQSSTFSLKREPAAQFPCHRQLRRGFHAPKAVKSATEPSTESFVARSLAAEDLRCGDFVAILQETVEWPSFFWDSDPQLLPPEQPVRLVTRGRDGGTPLKVKAICLPFVLVKKPDGGHRTLDVRQHRLVRLSGKYAQAAWKALSKTSSPCLGI